MIEQGKFRKDLYYRLNIINISVPPLRARVYDIPLLVNDLIEKHAKVLGKDIRRVDHEVMALFARYSWPGNIRELENVIERAVILTKGPVISLEDLPDHLVVAEPAVRIESDLKTKSSGLKLRKSINDSEYELILHALEAAEGSRNKAAENLGIDRTTLYKKMVRYGILDEMKKNKEKRALALTTQG